MKESHPLASPSRVNRLALIGIDRADWYDKAQLEIVRICTLEGWNPIEFTNTLAILSPKVSIRRNVRAALVLVGQGMHLATTMRTVKRSIEIYRETGIIGGRKVPFFAQALLGDRESVTLDTWMAHALVRVEEPSVSHFRRMNTFIQARELVAKVGRQLGLCPRDCQAAIWSGIFREHGQEPTYFPVREEYDRWLAYSREFPLSGTIGIPDREDYDDISFNPADLEF